MLLFLSAGTGSAWSTAIVTLALWPPRTLKLTAAAGGTGIPFTGSLAGQLRPRSRSRCSLSRRRDRRGRDCLPASAGPGYFSGMQLPSGPISRWVPMSMSLRAGSYSAGRRPGSTGPAGSLAWRPLAAAGVAAAAVPHSLWAGRASAGGAAPGQTTADSPDRLYREGGRYADPGQHR